MSSHEHALEVREGGCAGKHWLVARCLVPTELAVEIARMLIDYESKRTGDPFVEAPEVLPSWPR